MPAIEGTRGVEPTSCYKSGAKMLEDAHLQMSSWTHALEQKTKEQPYPELWLFALLLLLLQLQETTRRLQQGRVGSSGGEAASER